MKVIILGNGPDIKKLAGKRFKQRDWLKGAGC